MSGRLGTRIGATTPPLAAPVAGQDWASDLRGICQTLWPTPAEVRVCPAGSSATRGHAGDGQAAGTGQEYLLIPGIHKFPLIVPAGRVLAPSAVRHYSASRFATRVVSSTLAAGLAAGAGQIMFRDRVRVEVPEGADSIEAYLQGVFGRDIRVGLLVGPPRANRKPVVQVLSPAGETLGFAKVGVNPLTRELVEHERAALEWLARADPAGLRVPRVLHYGQWRELSVLVLGVLPVWRARRPSRASGLLRAMAAVAGGGGLRDAALGQSSYLSSLRERLADALAGPARTSLARLVGQLADTHAGTTLRFGAWHGDWVPWNMASTADGLLVWDWERFSADVPLGFDAIHHWLETRIGPRRRSPAAVAAACPDHAPALLAPFGVDPGGARLTAVLYLAEMATRYLVNQQAKAGAKRGDWGTWLIPALAATLERS